MSNLQEDIATSLENIRKSVVKAPLKNHRKNLIIHYINEAVTHIGLKNFKKAADNLILMEKSIKNSNRLNSSTHQNRKLGDHCQAIRHSLRKTYGLFIPYRLNPFTDSIQNAAPTSTISANLKQYPSDFTSCTYTPAYKKCSFYFDFPPEVNNDIHPIIEPQFHSDKTKQPEKTNMTWEIPPGVHVTVVMVNKDSFFGELFYEKSGFLKIKLSDDSGASRRGQIIYLNTDHIVSIT